MIPQRRLSRRLTAGILALLLVAALIVPLYGNRAKAGQEGVYIADNAYYTLDKVQLSPGSEKSTFRFTLSLVNGSQSTLDLNKYGASVWDASGNRYAVELAEKVSSRVAAGTTKELKYAAKVPAGTALDQLQVEIYSWDTSVSGYMRSIGKLSAAAAADASQSTKPQAIVDLTDVDTSYASDSQVNFELQRSYHALVNGNWNVYTELTAENLGSSSFKLPSGLLLSIRNGAGLSFNGSVVYGGDQAILPHQKTTIMVEYPVGDLNLADSLAIEFSKKTTGSTGNSSTASPSATASAASGSQSSTASSTVTMLESMNISGTVTGLEKGDIQANSASRTGLSATVESVSLDAKSDGVYAETVYTLKNDGKKAVTVPALTAFYQVGGSTLSVAAEDSASHAAFLAPGETTSYYYNAVLPSGVDGATIQLVVRETKSATVSIPVSVANLPAVSDTNGTPVSGGGSSYATSIGKLGITLKSSYRLLSDGGDDVIMSEVQVENQQSEAVKLPSMYAGYTDGVNELEGKVVYVQSSPYINPGQKAVLYVFAKVPYDLEMSAGKVYFGQGVLSAQNTWSQKKEWARLDFAASKNEITAVTPADTWYINDPGRLSTAWIAETKLYDSMTDSESSVTAAIRIAQQNQMARNGTVVPYTGYIQASNGEIYKLSTSASASKLNKDAKALTTLWAELPSGVLDDKAVVVFGQQIADGVFANPKQTSFAVSANKPGSTTDDTIDWKINASLYPYTVKFGGIKRTYASNKYSFEFEYKLEKTGTLAGSNTDRVLYFELEDNLRKVVKSWSVPLEGTGYMENGTQTLSLASSEIKYADDFLNGNRLKVYEKFADHIRLLGTLNYMTLGD